MNLLDRLSDNQRDELLAALGQHGAIKDFADRHGLNANSLRGAISRNGFDEAPVYSSQQAVDVLKTVRSLGPVPAAVRVIDEPITLHLKKWLYASDFHVPLHSERALKRLVAVGVKNGGLCPQITDLKCPPFITPRVG